MTATTIVVGILVLGAGIAALLVLRSARGRRQALQDVPPAMRPGYSDQQLEQTVQYRYRAWGMVLFIFFALFLPIYWFFEAGRLNAETEGFFVQSVVRGEELYAENCSSCHGGEGQGGAAASPYGDDTWPAPDLTTIAARYEENPNIGDIREYVTATIVRGRPGTPMPTWGSAFGGPLTDQQIEEITDWILAHQVPLDGAEEVPDESPGEETPAEGATEAAEAASVALSGEELYLGNCARCHGENAAGVYVPAEGEEGVARNRPGPSLIGVFERHDRDTILGILANGINVSNVITMPPWQNGHMYPQTQPGLGGELTDEQLNAIVDHLQELQPADIPPEAEEYQAPGTGPPPQIADDVTTALHDAARG